MASAKVRFDASKYKQKLSKLLVAYGDLRPVMQEASEYMVRATKNRVYQGRRDPVTGEAWAPLSDSTIQQKGSSRPLVRTGTLAQSIQAIMVSKSGFTVRAPARNDRGQQYAGWMQDGFRHKSGKSVPPRRFLGFSEVNKKHISKLLSDHIKSHSK